MTNEIVHYTYGNTPATVPLGPALDDGDDLSGAQIDWRRTVQLAGESPDDEEISVALLTESWRQHSAGDLVVSGLTCDGHALHVIPAAAAVYYASVDDEWADLGETGSLRVATDGSLYSRREENCDELFCGRVADVDGARARLRELETV